MKKLDTFWETNPAWYGYKGFTPYIKEDAPKEAKESFKKYQEQTKNYKHYV